MLLLSSMGIRKGTDQSSQASHSTWKSLCHDFAFNIQISTYRSHVISSRMKDTTRTDKGQPDDRFLVFVLQEL